MAKTEREQLQRLVGKTVREVRDTEIGDDGIVIVFTDDTALEIAYSGDEGTTYLDGHEVEPW